MKIYVLTGSWQDYDTADDWIVRAYITRPAAENRRDLCQTRHMEIHQQWNKDWDEYRAKTYKLTRGLKKHTELERAFHSRWYNEAGNYLKINEYDDHPSYTPSQWIDYNVYEVELEDE